MGAGSDEYLNTRLGRGLSSRSTLSPDTPSPHSAAVEKV